MSEEKKECEGCSGDCHCEHEHKTNEERMAEHIRREELVENIKAILEQAAQRPPDEPPALIGLIPVHPVVSKPTDTQGNKLGRNSPCPCGSGKKFKKCCLNAQPVQMEEEPAVPNVETNSESPENKE